MNKRSRNNYSQIQRKGIFTFYQTKRQKEEKSFNRVSLNNYQNDHDGRSGPMKISRRPIRTNENITRSQSEVRPHLKRGKTRMTKHQWFSF